jgi:ferredoxin
LRLVVDLTLCQGYAQCCFFAPEAFRLIGDEVLMYDPNPDDGQRELIARSAAACPVQTIFIDARDAVGPAGG